MAYNPSRLAKVMLKEQSAWGTAATVTASDQTLVECELMMPAPTQEVLTTDTVTGDFHAAKVAAGSKYNAVISLKMPMHGWSAAAPTAAPAAGDLHADALLLKNALGGVYYKATSYGTAGPTNVTTSQYRYTSSEYGSVEAGQAILVPVTDAPKYGVAWIQTITDAGGGETNLNFIQSLASTDATTEKEFGSINTFLQSTTALPITMLWLGDDTASKLTFYDGTVTKAKITANPKEQPILEVDITFLNWTSAGSGGGVSQYAYNLPQLPACIGSNGARAVIANTDTAMGAFEVEITTEAQPIGQHSGDQGCSQYLVTNRTVVATVELPSTALNTDLGTIGGTAALQVDLCTTPGRAISLLMPAGQEMELSTLGDSNGIVSVTRTYQPAQYDDDGTDGSVAADDTPQDKLFRVAFL